ncbi:hypothetical protein ONS95_014182 [Cadophora gregata]|uniref:uncharacterized protein n=1 Tax=Cadophora gregata TaxID=51156 RepID=UPI0026DCCCC1|nr:uncharacterized protein ONS95_014182 [Cadophora gregata]KAK0113931.1 hypothetical protein ONS96_014780 [Cadophora gregata f. sp. sojae]KAK0114697.1 hypothetical protein ONS95_014182 [Cadophora gregata]
MTVDDQARDNGDDSQNSQSQPTALSGAATRRVPNKLKHVDSHVQEGETSSETSTKDARLSSRGTRPRNSSMKNKSSDSKPESADSAAKLPAMDSAQDSKKITPINNSNQFRFAAPPNQSRKAIQLLGNVFGTLKRPMYLIIYYAVVCGIIGLAAIFIIGFTLSIAKSTACAPPILRRTLPFCEPLIRPTSHVEFQKLGNLQNMLEEIQEASVGGVTLPLLMKRGENAVREVAVNVELSNLPSKNEISKTLREFQKRAHTAGDDLRTFNSHLDRTMDSIISTNEWTVRTLGDIAREEDVENNNGALTSFVNKGLSIFEGPKPSTEEAVALQYIRHLSQVKDDIDVLITEAGLSVMNLEALENLLWSVTRMGKNDGNHITKSKTKASKKLSAIFGLNWDEIEGLEEQSVVVLQLLEQKDVALARVTGMLEHLKEISAGLGDLRERVAVPGQPQAQKVPLLVQIDTINRGLQRLEKGRERTRQKKDRYLKEIRDQIR